MLPDPPLSPFFDPTRRDAAAHLEWHLRHDLALGSRDDLASAVARLVVWQRCPPRLRGLWAARAAGGAEHDPTTRAALEAYLRPAFRDPAEGGDDHADHEQGLVAQYLWYALTVEAGHTDPHECVHPPPFSVTDGGGDGFVVHRDAALGLVFRLWEIKKSTAAAGPRSAVARAYGQLEARGAEYLAKVAMVAQSEQDLDPELVELYGALVEHWLDATPQAAAGVALTTSPLADPAVAFADLGDRFARFATPVRLRGMLTVVEDFAEFTRQVARVVWSGL